MADRRRNWGLLAEFQNPARLLEAAQAVRERGYTKFETWSPFPIHGMDDAMGLKGSRLGWIVLAGGLTGLTTGLTLQWWAGTMAYPLVIGGKPLFAWEFALPVTFELSVLLSAFGAVFGMFALNRMPKPFHPLDRVKRFKKVTDDAFFLSIEAGDPKFDLEESRKLLESLGGTGIVVVEE
ncbi:MAG: DUF3341 domain-containing protein [Myxococcales bacterium]|nr:DUF3341 domain-containing protein [Myxococcales bacterium]MCB9544353.1 DUF3341 domain-containing protein [Myxococcales bacterium]